MPFSDPITAGGVLVQPSIRSPNFVTGATGWIVRVDGTAEFNSLVVRNGQIISGEALYYSGTPALGNLIASVAAAAGTDTYGNAFLAGEVSYWNPGPGSFLALQFNQASITFSSAPAAGGPWTGALAIQFTAAGNTVMDGPLIISAPAAAGGVLQVTNQASPSHPTAQFQADTGGDPVIGVEVTGDSAFRLIIDSRGVLNWGPGSAGTDTNLYRSGGNTLQTDDALVVGAGLTVQADGATIGGGIDVTGNSVIANELVVGASSQTTPAALEVHSLLALASRAGPSAAPAGFGYLYVSNVDGSLHYKGTATDTKLANA